MPFVLRMKQVQGLVNYGPYVNLQYNYEVRSRVQYLDLDIINFSAFHMPACVLQSPHVEDPEAVVSAFKSHVFTKFQVQELLVWELSTHTLLLVASRRAMNF